MSKNITEITYMGRKKNQSPARLEIIKAATELFFENGFSKTTAHAVCKRANIGTGNLTFYFPTKEHILAVLVKMLCEYQDTVLEEEVDEGKSSLLAYCLEVTAMAAITDEDPKMQDLYVAAYSHPMTLDIIRANDFDKIKQIFGSYCENWSDERFTEAEAIVSGIEFSTIIKTEHSASLRYRIAGGLNAIMLLFGVPDNVRRMKIEKVLAMDYTAIGRRICNGFRQYATETTEHALEELMKRVSASKAKGPSDN